MFDIPIILSLINNYTINQCKIIISLLFIYYFLIIIIFYYKYTIICINNYNDKSIYIFFTNELNDNFLFYIFYF